jgi:DNA-binding FrmR family transcriptional regulator
MKTFYSKVQKENLLLIHDDDSDPSDEYTQAIPLENEPYQFYDEQINQWVVDTEKKERAEKEAQLKKIKSQIANIDAQFNILEGKLIRPMLAHTMGTETEDDTAKLDEIAAEINVLRTERAGLTDLLSASGG